MIKKEFVHYMNIEKKRKQLKNDGYVSSVSVSSNLRIYSDDIVNRKKLFSDLKKIALSDRDTIAIQLDISGTIKMYYLHKDVARLIYIANKNRLCKGK